MIRYLFLISLLGLIACENNKPDPQLVQAFEVHQNSLVIYDSLINELRTLKSQPLGPEQKDELNQLAKSGAQWEEQLVEVPGFEHAEGHDHGGHDHDHGHNHGGPDMDDLPPAEILKIQTAMETEVSRLLSEVRKLASSPGSTSAPDSTSAP
ncbi:MAG: hypothetical protein AAF804_19485 [Bacteroidota bacterium]